MTDQRPTDWRVEYGERRQFKAWFDDQAHAVEFAVRHGGIVVPLAPVNPAPIPQTAGS